MRTISLSSLPHNDRHRMFYAFVWWGFLVPWTLWIIFWYLVPEMSHLTYSRSLTATTGFLRTQRRFLWTSLVDENFYITYFSINSGLTHTHIGCCIQLLTNIWCTVLPGSNDCMVHTNWNSCPCDILVTVLVHTPEMSHLTRRISRMNRRKLLRGEHYTNLMWL